jgi:hypothetical protein
MSMMPLAVLRRIFENHRACKNECSLHGELRNWLNAYGGDEKPTPRAVKPSLEDLEIIEHDDVQRPHVIVDGRNGDTLERIENATVAEALELALDIAVDAARLRDSIKTEQALGHLADYTDEFGKRYRELDVKLRKAGYR